MKRERFETIIERYRGLRIAVAGDYSLDRYLEIDPARSERSIETGREVHNVVRVRAQPGSAGTILNNLSSLGIGHLVPVGFCGDDGEGYELRKSLEMLPSVQMEHFVQTPERRTFTSCKPLVMNTGQPPEELNRLDSKNWSPTPVEVQDRLIESLESMPDQLDALVVMDQVEMPETGVVTTALLEAVRWIANAHRSLPIIADSRRGLSGFPPVIYKMNSTELAAMAGVSNGALSDKEQTRAAAKVSAATRQPVFVTQAEGGILGVTPDGRSYHRKGLPVRGEIDIVGAGDAVTANLIAALSGGAEIEEAMELARAAASIVIHQLGTTGTATVEQLAEIVLEK